MNFLTHNDIDIDPSGTSLQGYFTKNYYQLVELLGEPTNGDGYKVDAEWYLQFDDGTIATIYNYKDGINYNGKDGTPTDQIYHWHVGGRSQFALVNVFRLVSPEKTHAVTY